MTEPLKSGVRAPKKLVGKKGAVSIYYRVTKVVLVRLWKRDLRRARCEDLAVGQAKARTVSA